MDEKDEIGKLLEEYQMQKTRRENGEDNALPELEPPKRSIDFSADKVEEQEPAQSNEKAEKNSEKQQKETDKIMSKKKREENKNTFLIIFNTVKTKLMTKNTAIFLVALVLIILAAFGIKYAANRNKNAYLTPYENEYNIDFPDGMLKEYCDYYGENQNTAGYIKIKDIDFESPVYIEATGEPSVKRCMSECTLQNYIISLDTKELEKHYNSASAYNDSQGYIEYSNLFENYRFSVVGAFYTNTDPDDDNGYVFPYKTPETMTEKSASTFVTDLQTRFLYYTQNFSRKDKLLIITCPTDLREGFEFVLVCKMTDSNKEWEAKEVDESRIHYPQIVYDDKGIENPYRLANGWYPEVVVNIYTDDNGESVTEARQLTELDYM